MGIGWADVRSPSIEKQLPNSTFQRSFASFARAHYATPAELCVRQIVAENY
jgi:hypothetical protein